MRIVNIVALILVIIGALNWLLVCFFQFDLVASLFAGGYGTLSAISRIAYVLIGLSGLWLLFTLLPQVSTEQRYPVNPNPM